MFPSKLDRGRCYKTWKINPQNDVDSHSVVVGIKSLIQYKSVLFLMDMFFQGVQVQNVRFYVIVVWDISVFKLYLSNADCVE